jgi:hypothetical protein
MKKFNTSLERFWSTDTCLTSILIFLVLSIFIFYPLSHIYVFRITNSVLFSLILVSGAAMVLKQRFLATVLSAFIGTAIILNFAKLSSENTVLLVFDALASFVCCGLLTVIILVLVFKEGRITGRHIQGAIAVYLLLGLMWAFLYQILSLALPGAFLESGAIPQDTTGEMRKDLTYFSFVTLTTVGYGDIIPVHPLARMLVMLEALIGQLFPAILLAWLVSMQIYHRHN